MVDVGSTVGATELDVTTSDGEEHEEGGGDDGAGVSDSDDADDADADGALTELHRMPAEVEFVGRDAFVFRVPRDGAGVFAGEGEGGLGGPSVSGQGVSDAEDVARQFEVLVPVSQLGHSEKAAQALARVAERIGRLQSSQDGFAVPPAALQVRDSSMCV